MVFLPCLLFFFSLNVCRCWGWIGAGGMRLSLIWSLALCLELMSCMTPMVKIRHFMLSTCALLIFILSSLGVIPVLPDFGDLFATVSFLLQKIPGSTFITTYHNRRWASRLVVIGLTFVQRQNALVVFFVCLFSSSGHHLIEFLLVKWGLKCTKLLDVYSFMPSDKASTLQGNIQLVEIVLDHQP